MFVIPHTPPLGDADREMGHQGDTVAQTYFKDLRTDDGREVVVQYTSREVRGGPGEFLIEIDVLTAWLKSDEDVDVDFTTEEGERWVAEIAAKEK